MANGSGPYLVQRRDDGYGDVFPLQDGQRLTLGRANTNRVVLKDELCSREHAEVYRAEGRWQLRDLKSLNGTLINGAPLKGDWELTSGDEFQVGHSRFVFVDRLEDLPDLPPLPQERDGISIKKRLGQTRFLTPVPDDAAEATAAEGAATTTGAVGAAGHSLSRDLSLLYRLALDMGTAPSYPDLARMVLDALLEATSAEVGAVLTMKEGRNLEVTAQRHRDPKVTHYLPVSEFVSHEVVASREAILAEDIARDRYLRSRESLQGLGATSLICAPVIQQTRVMGLIHLYCTDPLRALSTEDLEFTVAVAKQLAMAGHQLQKQETLANANQTLRAQLRLESELVGDSGALRHIHEQVARVADTNATVLIRGESGVGKELVARAIHYSSPRREGPFVCLNCAAITETLLESELFGHEKGAFTGATEKKIGKFEAAHQGTIFLDEIGEMSVGTQAKLLRILEGHPFERVGGGTPLRVDVRVVAATNQPLEKAIQESRFRKDLFYRLQVVEIQVPPLRDRPGDVPLLAEHFLKRFVRETGRKIRGFTEAAQRKMQQYSWPGNVRELRNVVERAVALGHGPVLDVKDIWLSSLETPEATFTLPEGDNYQALSLEEMEKRHIARTLAHTEWNKSQAAVILGIERSTLDRKIKIYNIVKDG